jgi:hypothetical protein
MSDKLQEVLIKFIKPKDVFSRGARVFPSLWEGLGEGLRRVLAFVFEGGVNDDIKNSNAVFIIETAG